MMYNNVNYKKLNEIQERMGKMDPYLIKDTAELEKLLAILDEPDITYPMSLTALHEALVPMSGMAPTKGGELVRACMRLAYRFINDGDRVSWDNEPDEIESTADYLVEEWGEYATGQSLSIEHPCKIVKNARRRVSFDDIDKEDYEAEVLDPLVDYILTIAKDYPNFFMEENTIDSREYDY